MNILDEASKLTTSDRNETYGDPRTDFNRTASIFNAITGHKLTCQDAITFMVCVKLSREQHVHGRDNLVDAVGYLRLLSQVQGDEEDE